MTQKPDLRCVGGNGMPGSNQGSTGTNQDNELSMKAGTLPAVLMKARRAALEELLQSLTDVFDKADDTFFEYAEKAASDQDKDDYLETMRQIRLNRKEVERKFFQQINGVFKELTQQQAIEEKPVGLESISSLDSLSLVENDDLEMDVALEGMISKAKTKFGDRIYQLSARLDAMLFHVTVNDKNNPFHPTHICNAFRHAADEIDCDIKNRLVIFKLFDKYVISRYDLVLDAANSILAEAGILPDLKGSPATSRRSERRSASALSDTQQGTTETTKEVARQAASELFGQLQTLLASARSVPMVTDVVVGTIGSEAHNAREVSNDELFDLLTRIQQSQPGDQELLSGYVQPVRFNVREAVANVLQTRESKAGPERVGQADSDVINLVAMLFDFILDDENLPIPVKAIIGRLQIPYLKLAVQDYSFFNRGAHPARKLLNELARAGIGLSDDVDQLQKDLVFKKIQQTSQRILNEFQKEPELFEALLQDFSQFMQTEARRAQMIEQRTKAAEEGKAKTELAEKIAMETVRKRLDGRTVPEVVVRLLTDGWMGVLKLVFLKYGPESNNWMGAVKTIDHLLFSVTPPRDEIARKKLFNVVPVLLKNLRQGLNSVSFNPFEMGEMLTELEQVQMQILRGETPGHLDDRRVDPAKDLVAAVTEDMERMGASPVIPARSKITQLDSAKAAKKAAVQLPALADDDPYLLSAGRINVGTWLEFRNDTGVKTRCKLAAHIKSADKMIFVNRTGVKIDEKSTLGLAHALKNAEVVVLEDSQLFDRALQNVIGNLRKVKQANL
ncbi:MAG: DUF1631 domain-containing protein [Ketobacter sp.]|nr:MAG: DUF1631 domain-containing protein [Ketobacter sp.]